MKRLTYILTLVGVLLTFSHNVSATIQFRDIIIIEKKQHVLNTVLLYQLDSATYDALAKKLDFASSSHSANWKGHISTFEVKGNKLFLNNIETSRAHTDFKGLLDKYMNKKGRVFASWVSGTLVCGSGECLYATETGLGSIYEQETELIVENGIVMSSRTQTNKTSGTLHFNAARSMISQRIDLGKINAPEGRVIIEIDASEFSDEGRVVKWSVKFLKGHENLSVQIRDQIVAEINRVFNSIDWKTYRRNGKWYWIHQGGVLWVLR